ncbi:MAG TPA: hypothetical protein VG604_02395 [Candidatus Saccharimonadales bacterium]|nr:hypothetical protein [Candidatus Saccharimonadales bacterium]
MFQRRSLTRFGVRLAVSLIVLGGLYVAIFGWPQLPKSRTDTIAGRISRLRVAVDQSYIDSLAIAGFHQNDPASYSVMGSLASQLQTNTKTVSTSLENAPSQVTKRDRQQIQDFVDRQNASIGSYNAAYNILLRVIAYDPQADIGKINFSSKDRPVLISRAEAAADGLERAANNSTSSNSNILGVGTVGSGASVIANHTKQSLLNAAKCFSALADQLKNRKDSAATKTRANCINNYPASRLAAIDNVIGNALPDSYQSYLKKTVPPLLESLDRAATSANEKTKPQ